MSTLLFPDNTVLVNFGHLNRLDLLERIANGNGRWCATVATECAQSARLPGLGALRGAAAIFGQPLMPESGVEYLDVLMFRRELARPGDGRHRHLGEAETLAIMKRRAIRGVFVTDDRDATRLARRHGCPTATTWDLLRLARRTALTDTATLRGYVRTLETLGRGRPPGAHDRLTLEAWLVS